MLLIETEGSKFVAKEYKVDEKEIVVQAKNLYKINELFNPMTGSMSLSATRYDDSNNPFKADGDIHINKSAILINYETNSPKLEQILTQVDGNMSGIQIARGDIPENKPKSKLVLR